MYIPVKTILFDAHRAEAADKKAELLNFAVCATEHYVVSKTCKGRLFSEINPATGTVSHWWAN